MNQKGLAPLLIVILIALAVGGYLIYQKQPQSTPTPTPQPQQTTQPSPQADETADLKTYTNDELSFKYPNSWATKPNNIASTNLHGVISLDSPNFTSDKPAPATIGLSYYDNPAQLSLKEFEQKNTGASGYSLGVYSSEGVVKNIGGISAQFVPNPICEPVLCDRYAISYKNKIYLLTTYYNSKEEQISQEQRNILDQILSTFKFTQ